MEAVTPVIEPIWCVVANVRPEAFGRATAPGTRQFRAGALLWVHAGHWGDGFERVNVVGHHRKSKRLISIIIEAARLTNWRAKGAYDPKLVAILASQRHGVGWATKEECERAAHFLNLRFPPVPDLQGEIGRRAHALHLLDHDPRGSELERQAAVALGGWTAQQRQVDRLPPMEVFVLADWLEDQGVPIALDELVRTLDRRRVL